VDDKPIIDQFNAAVGALAYAAHEMRKHVHHGRPSAKAKVTPPELIKQWVEARHGLDTTAKDLLLVFKRHGLDASAVFEFLHIASSYMIDIADERKVWAAIDNLKLHVTGRVPGIRGRLMVDGMVAILDGQTYPVNGSQRNLLERLLEARGGWVGAGKGARNDKVRKSLPGPIKALIEAKSGKGTRLKI
jgi:hypothetical protein